MGLDVNAAVASQVLPVIFRLFTPEPLCEPDGRRCFCGFRRATGEAGSSPQADRQASWCVSQSAWRVPGHRGGHSHPRRLLTSSLTSSSHLSLALLSFPLLSFPLLSFPLLPSSLLSTPFLISLGDKQQEGEKKRIGKCARQAHAQNPTSTMHAHLHTHTHTRTHTHTAVNSFFLVLQ